ncbi:MAG: hypothetical protein JWN32_3054 [Solirubrobacterales bacterium]|jgi:hypothetical protein|nr:hypothetical protein [Solirubrobacterales bacterium]
MSDQPSQPTDDELRAALEQEMKRLRVEDVLLQSVVSLINLGIRRLGVAEGTQDERDLEQARLAIEAVRALMGVLEEAAPEQLSAIRDGLSRLQLAYVQEGGQAPPGGGAPGAETPAPEPPRPGESGPAQRSGRLWVPGQ